jgi:predicted GTPase
MGAAGRDFHNFNVFFRDNRDYEVVAFTATQIPNIDKRVYPPILAGELYPDGIPIIDEEELPELIRSENIDVVVFAYSDVSNEYVMDRCSLVNSKGADFWLMGPKATSIKSGKPLISVCAARTGSGKSPTTRKIAGILRSLEKRVVAIRHPMPYGDLAKQVWQRFETPEDLDAHRCTIEEREEYLPLIKEGVVVYAGVDYGKIIEEAGEEADLILWDGGNNDVPFYESDYHIVIVDPLRAGDELKYYPGRTNVIMADLIIISKVDVASHEKIEEVEKNVRSLNPTVEMIRSRFSLKHDAFPIEGKKALVVEDGPTVTHGGMGFGAGAEFVQRGGGELVDPRPFATGSLKEVFAKYSHLRAVLPAMGYFPEQLKELEETINSCDCDCVVIGTPVDLRELIKIEKPAVKVGYEYADNGDLEKVVKEVVRRLI